jgi:hypothetical protein
MLLFTNKANIPFNPIRDNVFFPKKFIKLLDGMSTDAEIMLNEPAIAVKGNRKKLPYLQPENLTTGESSNGTLFRLNVASKHTAVSTSIKMFRYGSILS